LRIKGDGYCRCRKHTQLVNSFTTSLQTSRTATRVARSHVTKVFFDAFSYKLLKTWKQNSTKTEKETINGKMLNL
jgi:hypothetical protein